MSTSKALVTFSKDVSFMPFPTTTLDKEASSFNAHKTLLLATVRVPVLFKALAVKHPKPCWVRSPSHQSVPNQMTRWSFYQKWKWIRSALPLRGCTSAMLGLQFLSQHSKVSKRSKKKKPVHKLVSYPICQQNLYPFCVNIIHFMAGILR